LLFFLAGAFSQAVQAVLAREMLVVFYGNELSLGFFYGFWLLWIAAGAAGAGKLAGRLRPIRGLAGLSALLPAAAGSSVLLFRICRRFIDVSPSEFVPLDQLALWCLLATLPVGLVVGALFPLACRSAGQDEDAPPLYITDALGGMAGGVLFTFVLVDRLGHLELLGAFGILLGGVLFFAPGSGDPGEMRFKRGAGAGAAALGLLLALSPLGNWSERFRWDSIHPKLELLESFSTPVQSVAVARREEQISIIADGKVAASFPEKVVPAVEAALIYSQVPKAEKLLIIEGVASGLLPELLRYPAKTIVTLEADQKAHERILAYLPKDYRMALQSDRVKVRFGDPRAYINKGDGQGSFDIVISLLADPATASLNRYYTREYFQHCAKMLTDGGIFVAKVTSASNYLGKDVKSYSSSVFSTILKAFKHVKATPGDSNYFLASNGDEVLSLDPAVLSRRYLGIPLSERRFPAQAFSSILQKSRVDTINEFLRDEAGEINSDSRPVTYFLNLLLWARFSDSAWLDTIKAVKKAGLFVIFIPLLVFISLRLIFGSTFSESKSEARFSSGLVMVGLGFCAMAAQIVLVFCFQSKFGDVFQKIGLLNGTVMLGLAVGAFLSVKLRQRFPQRSVELLIFVAGLASLFAFLLPFLIDFIGRSGSQPAFCLLVLAAGVFMGTGFPLAFWVHRGASSGLGVSSGLIDALDHLGGVAGSLLTGACIVPLFGIRAACLAAGGLLLLSLLPLAQMRLKSWEGVQSAAAWAAGLPVLRLRERAVVSLPANRLNWVLFGAVFTVWAVGFAAKEAEPPLLRFSESELASVAGPGGFEAGEAPFFHYRMKEDGRPGGAVFASMAVVGDIKGYAGPMNLLTAFSEQGRVLGLKIVESRETPSYIDGIEGWFDKLKGLDATRPLRLGAGIDAFSGATVTSQAVLDIIDQAGKDAGEKILGLEVDRGEGARSWTAALGTWRFWSIALLLGAFFPVFLSGRERPRLLYLVAALVVLGLLHNTLFTLVDAANILGGRFPDTANAVWYMLAGFILLTSLLWGQAYCGFVCPFGALQELLWEAGKRLGLRAAAQMRFDRALRQLKYLLLAGALILYFLTGQAGWITFNPMQHVFGGKMGPVLWALFGVTAVGALSYFRFWCRYFCPAGALLALSNKLAVARRWAPRRMFSLCAHGARSEFDVDCLQCQRCLHHPSYAKLVGGQDA